MNRSKFISNFSDFIQIAVKLNERALVKGISALEYEMEDLDDEFFKQGLRFVVDNTDTSIIDEVMSNKISFEKDKYTRLFKTIQKRTVLAIQARITNYYLIHILFSYAGLQEKEQMKIERIILLEDSYNYNVENEEEEESTIVVIYEFESPRNWAIAIETIEIELGKNPTGVDFGNLKYKQITIKSNCTNIEQAEQIIKDNGGIKVEILEF